MTNTHQVDNTIDDHVDNEIEGFLNLEKPVSFFLFAGAGSGKTRSLVEALKRARPKYGRTLRLRGQQIGVITYTNNACDEIKERVEFDDLFAISTIHSFVWTLIRGFNNDIRGWLQKNLAGEIAELNVEQQKGRSGTKAAIDRANSIASKERRLEHIKSVKQFVYNPDGENTGRDSLNHSEVLKIASDFLSKRPAMQRILVQKYPILLIDESQDTNKHLMDALLEVQTKHAEHFALGLFGDVMQRIYADGKADLGKNLPQNWARPAKQMNHRCPKRVVALINKIREAVDGQKQIPRVEKDEGFIRLFVLPHKTSDKVGAEARIAKIMAETTGDTGWLNGEETKTLILEHHMAARRMGFFEMYEPLYNEDSLRVGLLDGTLAGVRLFSELIYPTVEAKRRSDQFAVASIVRRHSPLLSKAALNSDSREGQIKMAKQAVETLYSLWNEDGDPTFLDVLNSVATTNLFEIPEALRPIVNRSAADKLVISQEVNGTSSLDTAGSPSSIISAWDTFLGVPFRQIQPYVRYITGQASFETHQGVKGLQYPRVMVVIDDESARGFAFAYEKLFGIKPKTKADSENERAGKETGIDRTRRLFYVTCSRAEKSLAIVAYSENPKGVCDHVLKEGWFAQEEVITHC